MSSRIFTAVSSVVFLMVALVGCGDSSSSATLAQYRIVAMSGGALTAAVGDAFRLSVVEGLSDGTAKPLATGAKVTWSGPPLVTALPSGSAPEDSILPQPGVAATAMWIANPDHLSDAQVAGVLYVLDTGTAANPSIDVKASVVEGSAPAGEATASVSVEPFPVGDVTRGQGLYAANCATCHGAQGEGGTAPGLNAGPNNVASDPSWSPQMLGISARSNMDNVGVSLAATMPKWLVVPGADGQLLTTQNFSDMYAFLKTQGGETPAASP
jgi:mono/diheme cytochrome c family protein